MRHALNRCRSRPDDAHALVSEFVQAASGVAAGVVVVPPAGVEGMSLELLDPWNRGQLGPVQGPARHDDKARLEDIAAIGGDRPAPCFLIPARLFDLRLEAGLLIEIEVLADPLGVLKDLGRERSTFPSGCSRSLRAAADRRRIRCHTGRRDSGSSTRSRQNPRLSR